MKQEISKADLISTATQLGLVVEAESGGYRITDIAGRALFPRGGPPQSKKACGGFLLGVSFEQRRKGQGGPTPLDADGRVNWDLP